MATKPKKSRRNRKFGPNLVLGKTVDHILSTTSSRPATSPVGTNVSPPWQTSSFVRSSDEPYSTSPENQSMSDELSELKKWGILPGDFPSPDGDITDLVDPIEDVTNKLDESLQIGAISSSDADDLKASEKQTELNINEKPKFFISNNEIPDFDQSGWPTNWIGYDTTSDVYKLVELERGDPDFDGIEQEFSNAYIQVKTIERLENKRILDRFKAEAEDLNRHRFGDFCINIKYLYHGTNVNIEALCEEGLDQRLSRMGYFGHGIYFSDNPLKCVHYSEDIKQEGPYEAYILKCRVILGDIKVYPKGASNIDLKREPEKEMPSHGSKYYDSVLGCPKDFNEYVVYENRRAMIEYIIKFQAESDIIKNLRQLSKTRSKGINSANEEITEAQSVLVIHGDQSTDDSPSLESQDDHFSRISDVREAVRKKRLGASYIPPTREQKKKDKEMWKKIQELQSVRCDKSPIIFKAWKHPPNASFQERNWEKGETVETEKSSTFLFGTEKPPPVIMWDNENTEELQDDQEFLLDCKDDDKWQRLSQSNRNEHLQFQNNVDNLSESSNEDSILWTDSWSNQSLICSDTSNNQGRLRDDNPVEQVLSVCVAEFLSVTGLEDAGLAKHYVMKAEMDLNRAISLYYEDIM